MTTARKPKSRKTASSGQGNAEAKGPEPRTSRERVREFRQRMREKGMREVRFWVPDVRSPEFLEMARREMREIAMSPMAKEDQDFVDAISVDPWADE